ncbi:hypothetical protein [Kitasatospora sp. NPDC096140]|uniref:hypothetical protein n=1 Tax=unclassified Kitasatospora TaxID=2633591 RepID=UPI00331EBA10
MAKTKQKARVFVTKDYTIFNHNGDLWIEDGTKIATDGGFNGNYDWEADEKRWVGAGLTGKAKYFYKILEPDGHKGKYIDGDDIDWETKKS